MGAHSLLPALDPTTVAACSLLPVVVQRLRVLVVKKPSGVRRVIDLDAHVSEPRQGFHDVPVHPHLHTSCAHANVIGACVGDVHDPAVSGRAVCVECMRVICLLL
jgi:hypothetical protein